jgi:hypothetical protein
VQGGGIDAASGNGTISIIASRVTGNVAKTGGGLVLASKEAATVAGSLVAGNSATSGTGGGIQIGNTPNFELSSSAIVGNNVAGIGGGVYAYNSTGSINSVTLSGNSATVAGGGAFNGGAMAGTIALIHPDTAGNTAPSFPDLDGTFSG